MDSVHKYKIKLGQMKSNKHIGRPLKYDIRTFKAHLKGQALENGLNLCDCLIEIKDGCPVKKVYRSEKAKGYGISRATLYRAKHKYID